MKTIFKSLAIFAGSLLVLSSCDKVEGAATTGTLTIDGETYPVRLEISELPSSMTGIALVSTNIVSNEAGQPVSGKGPVLSIQLKSIESGVYSIDKGSISTVFVFPEYDTSGSGNAPYISRDATLTINNKDGKKFTIVVSGTASHVVMQGTKADPSGSITFSAKFEGPADFFKINANAQ